MAFWNCADSALFPFGTAANGFGVQGFGFGVGRTHRRKVEGVGRAREVHVPQEAERLRDTLLVHLLCTSGLN